MAPLPSPYAATIENIYRHYERNARKRRGSRLGASSFGQECDRALWYGFRWAGPIEHFDGRKLRLFETGNREEKRMIDDLLAIGVAARALNPATKQQWEYVGCGGHLVAKLDGQGYGFDEAPSVEHLLEFKTHNDKSWRDIVTKGVEASKPGHFAQVQIGMALSGLTRAYYMAHNKNTDELYQERIPYDVVKAGRSLARAQNIIASNDAPPRLHENPKSKAAWQCGFCSSYAQCHAGAAAERNCRTCLSSTPVEGGNWHCSFLNKQLSLEEQKKGCASHLFIPSLVPGEQVDCSETARTVTYKLNTGETWVDGK